MAADAKSFASETDWLLAGSFGMVRKTAFPRVARPPSLQTIVNETCTRMLAADLPIIPQRVGGKVFSRLLKPGRAGTIPVPLSSSLQAGYDFCVERLRNFGKYFDLAEALGHVCGRIAWTKAPPGPFGSVNFANSHSQAVVIGPGGLEGREDVRIGLTVLAPYTRMPDSKLESPRSYLALSDLEFSTETTGWTKASAGAVLFASTGEIVACRCTAQPLLMLLCDLPDTNTFK